MTGEAARRQERQRRFKLGLRGETLAALYLRAKGYRVLSRRFKTPVGEIDIVAARGRRLAFVEVKRRATFDAAANSVTPQAQRRMVRAAQYWLGRWPRYQDHDACFDVVLLAPRRWPEHMTNAFGVPDGMWVG